MQIIAILIGIVLLAAIIFYVSRPLLRQRGGVDVTAMASLEMQRDSLYSQIRELDMDHATGKTNDEDYQRIRAELVAQAAEVLKLIDGVAVTPVPVFAPRPAAARPAADGDVEALIAARRKAAAAPPPAPSPAADDLEAAITARRKVPASAPAAPKTDDGDVEALIAARRKSPVAAAPVRAAEQDIEAQIAARRKTAAPAPVVELACPNCGKPVAADDAFCAKCGTSLRAQTA